MAVRPHSILGALLAACVGWLVNVAGLSALGDETIPEIRPAAETVLRLARSIDGTDFDDTGVVFCFVAAAPGLVVLDGGDVLAVFDSAAHADAVTLAVSRSRDSGRTWSPARRIRFDVADRSLTSARHGEFVVASDGALRLYYAFDLASRSRDARHGRSRHRLVGVRSAVSSDGVLFRLERDLRTVFRSDGDVHPMVGRVGGDVHLYGQALLRNGAGDVRAARVRHVISHDGLRFVGTGAARAPATRFVGSVLPVAGGVRAYVTSRKGIVSLASNDGKSFRREPGVRVPHAWDPAVVRLPDGSYLMLYCAAAGDNVNRATALVMPLPDEPAGRYATASWTPSSANAEEHSPDQPDSAWTADEISELLGALMAADPDNASADAAGQSLDPELVALVEQALAGAETDELAGEDFQALQALLEKMAADEAVAASRPVEGEDGIAGEATVVVDDAGSVGPFGDTASGTALGDDAEPIHDNPDGFAPLPDFQKWVSYLDWWQRNLAADETGDNAAPIYAEFMPGMSDDPKNVPGWPSAFTNMFSDVDYDGPPVPWDPAKHPEWEASRQSAQEALTRYREATLHAGYATSTLFSEDEVAQFSDGDPLLLGLLLPNLSSHRHLAKQVLADAWRMEDGKVSGEKMIEAWDTTLRNAAHLDQGATIIENLVSVAQRGLVQKSARWALKQGVFDGDELETALQTLQELDRSTRDPTKSIRGEHAFSMDMLQYIFSPGDDADGPRVHAERAHKLTGWMGTDDTLGDRLAGMTAADARASVEAFDGYYRDMADQLRIGYPKARVADLDALADKYIHTSPLTEVLMPALSRVYTLQTRSEASRRATQLAYATHLFKERNGRWPDSLDELPAEFGETMRIDPFTGRYFGYRLDEDGPRIYSAGENGIDDGGIHSPRWEDKIDNDAGSDDHVFWPPQPRR